MSAFHKVNAKVTLGIVPWHVGFICMNLRKVVLVITVLKLQDAREVLTQVPRAEWQHCWDLWISSHQPDAE